ncbi:Molybdopterin cofactor biosynthesis C domain-containing protein [Leptodontidium sp. 2 PMI_412]|nr:Molybdopterin cofactor biosynthesis C domain-containing protein [Leptodontidium sp. 2 PMI_412]
MCKPSSSRVSTTVRFSRISPSSRSSPPWKQLPLHLLAPSPSAYARFYSTSSSLPPKEPSPSSSSTSPPRLTHLTPSGTAHMVPISHKTPTTRLATAVCTLHFSNPTALPLIRSNSMKKGDVLSVARIAGIMAAKRTAELVPLCHPIAITHVGVELEVFSDEGEDGETRMRESDVKGQESVSVPWQGTGQGDAYPFHVPSPHAPQGQSTDKVTNTTLSQSSNSNVSTVIQDRKTGFGRVEITATVQCDGKTGVEMEALTAASVAALTVYDMCKAVDKGMRIEDLRVVRKEGGKSGTWVEGESVGSA